MRCVVRPLQKSNRQNHLNEITWNCGGFRPPQRNIGHERVTHMRIKPGHARKGEVMGGKPKWKKGRRYSTSRCLRARSRKSSTFQRHISSKAAVGACSLTTHFSDPNANSSFVFILHRDVLSKEIDRAKWSKGGVQYCLPLLSLFALGSFQLCHRRLVHAGSERYGKHRRKTKAWISGC